MGVSDKLRWRRCINELKFVHEELKLSKEISREMAQEFQQYYEEYCSEHALDIKELNEENKEKIEEIYNKETHTSENDEETPSPGSLTLYDAVDGADDENEYQMTQDETEIHEAFSKLHKKLALALHPDKLSSWLTPEEREGKIREFKKMSVAFKARKYFVLLEIAEKYRITAPRNYKQQNRWVKREIVKIKMLVNKEKRTYNYMFSQREDKSSKDSLMRQFVNQIFGINL